MNITIVGGGTAGWISAFMISSVRKNIKVSVVDSSKRQPIGVGEGTTGKFLEILSKPEYQLNSEEFLKKTNSLPKLAIKFDNWSRHGSFYSPVKGSFTSQNYLDFAPFFCKTNGIDIDICFDSTYLSKQGYTNTYWSEENKQIQFHEFLPGIHLDTYNTIEFFKEKCLNLGVECVDAEVEDIKVTNNRIDYLLLDTGEKKKSDLYIDSTGFSKVLMSSLENEWVDYSDNLLVDTAITFKLDKPKDNKKTAYTSAIAMDNGWVFEIPTQKKTGRGYIFSSQYSDEETSVKELKEFYNTDVVVDKKINFKSGRLSKFLVGNCLAIGLSSAFLEPLQATSLHCTLYQIEKFIDGFIIGDNIIDDEMLKSQYNKSFAVMYDDMRDFILLHYTGGKTNTDFWKHISSMEYPKTLQQKLYLHATRLIRSYDFDTYDGAVGHSLWVPTLLGLNNYDKELINSLIKDEACGALQYAVKAYKAFIQETVVDNNLLTPKRYCKHYS